MGMAWGTMEANCGFIVAIRLMVWGVKLPRRSRPARS
jgi:hypothetical protein